MVHQQDRPQDVLAGIRAAMSSNSANGTVNGGDWAGALKPYLVLTKPMLNLLVVITTAAGFALASGTSLDWALLGWTLLGTLHAAMGASALNQRLEWRADGRMQRTRHRPIPMHRITPLAGTLIGLGLVIGGVFILAWRVNWLTAMLAALVVVIYLGIYTPLKRHSMLCTLLGAVCGAIPPLMGFSAATGRLDYAAWTLAALLFVWQVPHFLALAWRYREDYAQGGFVMLPLADGAGSVNSFMLLLYALALVPLALAPALAGLGGLVYIISSVALGSLLVGLAVRQYFERSILSARRVFLASIIYLPLLLVVLVAEHTEGQPLITLAQPQNSAPEAPRLNGFTLSSALIPLEQLAVGTSRDGIPALTAPAVIPGDGVEQANHSGGHGSGKFLVGGDRVIGVVVNGESRAYPLRLLSWHEVANDTLGGVPLAVTYCPLCDSAVVFDRRVGDETLEFGVSGLLYNSNLLMYDRRATDDDSSLWSQLMLRAVTGPAAASGRELTVLPAEIVHWDDWYGRHPDTTVISGDVRFKERYQRNGYGHYFITGELMFPVDPLPADDDPPLMSRVLAVREDGSWRAYLYDAGLSAVPPAEPAGLQTATGLGLTYQPHREGMVPPTLRLTELQDAETVYSCWFAWHAMYPAIELEELQ